MHFLKTITVKYVFFAITLFSSFATVGQTVDQDIQLWNDVILKYKFNENISHVGDIGARYFFDTRWSVFYIRPAIQWRINNSISVAGGLAMFYNANSQNENLTDYRIFQAVELVWPRIGEFLIHHRIIVEERWFVTETIDAQFKLRGRYRIGLFTPYYKLFGTKKSNYNQFLVEFLDYLDKENMLPFSNFQRYTIVLGHNFTKKLGGELHYQLQLADATTGLDIEQHVIRIRLKLNLNGM